MARKSILVVDDEKSQREILEMILSGEGYNVTTASSGEAALKFAHAHRFDLVLTDLKMMGMDGIELLQQLLAYDSSIIVILLTAHGSIDSAKEALRRGAFDYLQKPYDRDTLLETVGRALLRLDALDMEIVSASAEMEAVKKMVLKVARSSSTVLIRGESGTGKELIARAIHNQSPRNTEMFQAVNCAAINENLLESELFGHEKGAFTGAHAEKKGLFEVADRGTLFLDEISQLSPANQAKLLRLVENGETRRLGASLPEHVDVRIIAATNGDLNDLVARGRFREDLLYRLQAFTLYLPPLRERQEDIAPLAQRFIKTARTRYNKHAAFSPEALDALSHLPWKGNARELQSHIEHLMLTAEDDAVITSAMVETGTLRQPSNFELTNPWENFSLKDEIHRIERRFIELALKEAGGKVSHAARLLGFKHHESLNSLLKHRHKDLLEARQPVTPRRRSIMRKRDQ